MKKAGKQRLDMELVSRGIFPSRAKAQAAIMAGCVSLNGAVETKAGRAVSATDAISLILPACPYVSRGGLKLKAALDEFAIAVSGRVCADIGASTGGFTDCLLKAGAAKVYAVDVGKGQLDDSLLKNPAVEFMPETNARWLKPDVFLKKPDFAAIDVSFISLKLILGPAMAALLRPAEIVALIKPQFELTPKETPGGIVRQEEFRLQAVAGLKKFLAAFPDAKDCGVITSPVRGAKGNYEYLWHIRLTGGITSQS